MFFSQNNARFSILLYCVLIQMLSLNDILIYTHIYNNTVFATFTCFLLWSRMSRGTILLITTDFCCKTRAQHFKLECWNLNAPTPTNVYWAMANSLTQNFIILKACPRRKKTVFTAMSSFFLDVCFCSCRKKSCAGSIAIFASWNQKLSRRNDSIRSFAVKWKNRHRIF